MVDTRSTEVAIIQKEGEYTGLIAYVCGTQEFFGCALQVRNRADTGFRTVIQLDDTEIASLVVSICTSSGTELTLKPSFRIGRELNYFGGMSYPEPSN